MWQPMHRLPSPGALPKRFKKLHPSGEEGEEKGSYLSFHGDDVDGEHYSDADYLSMYGLLPEPVRNAEGAEWVEKYGIKLGHCSIQGKGLAFASSSYTRSTTLGVSIPLIFQT